MSGRGGVREEWELIFINFLPCTTILLPCLFHTWFTFENLYVCRGICAHTVCPCLFWHWVVFLNIARCLDVYYILRGPRMIYIPPMNHFQLLIIFSLASTCTLWSVKRKTHFSWICALNSWMSRWSPGTAVLTCLDASPALLVLHPAVSLPVSGFSGWCPCCSSPLSPLLPLCPSFPFLHCALISVSFPLSQIMS